jgi:hypothetical protein
VKPSRLWSNRKLNVVALVALVIVAGALGSSKRTTAGGAGAQTANVQSSAASRSYIDRTVLNKLRG